MMQLDEDVSTAEDNTTLINNEYNELGNIK